MSKILSTRFTRPSMRAMLALGGAAAVVAGAFASTDTLAASTDSGTANVSQIASDNFFPTPVPTWMNCSTGGSRANLSWENMGPQYKYRIEQWKNNSSFLWSQDQTGTSYAYNTGGTGQSDRVRIRTINTVTNDVSDGYISWSVYSATIFATSCSAGFPQENVTSWQQQSTWTPGAPQNRSAASGADKPVAAKAAPSSTPETAEEPSTEPTPSAEPSETPAPSTTETPETPSTTPSPTEPAEDTSKVTIGIGVAGDEKVLIVSRDGEEVCHTTLEEGDQPSINGNTVTIQNGGTVKTVDTATCAVS